MQFLFGEFVLDTDRRELRLGCELVATGPQVFDLLVYLVNNREHVVSKDDLLQAVWAGRIVSELTLTSHINAARKAVGDSGEEQRVIRTIARKGFRFVGEVRLEQPSAAADKTHAIAPPNIDDARRPPMLALPDKPSIAVLPFQNLSGDAEQEYFADGVVEDIIAALSRMRWLFVIARNSSFTYKGRAVDVKQVGRDLGVRYVLEGSVRRAANRVRISGQLVDASTAANLWSDRFEGPLEDIFDLQDQMTASVVGAIARQLEQAEIARAKRKPTESLDAYDYYLRGMANFHRGTREGVSEALPLFYKAMDLDPEFASAYAMGAWCTLWRKINRWMSDREKEISEGVRLARRAIELGQDDAVALARSGHALGHFLGDLDGGIALINKALVLDPNLAAAWFLGGFLRAFNGEPDIAVEHFARAMRLSPLDPETFRMRAGTALAHMLAGRLDLAAALAEEASRELPSFFFAVSIAVASHALAERQEEAQRALQNLRQLDATLRISNLKDWLPLQRPEALAPFVAGLRKAGLPE